MMVSRSHGAKRIESLAVLPLENLSPDPDQDYFASGMTEELITALARIGSLRVVPRMSVSQYAGAKKSLSQIAKELNVDALIEGSVTRDGDRVRITAQLIVEEPERHLWAEKYEASMRDILSMQDEVAKAVAREIQRRVTPGDLAMLSTHRTVDPAAYEAYLRGMYLNLNATEVNLKESIHYLQQAIDRAPSYAPAWAELGDSYVGLAAYGVLTYADAYTRAKAAAEKALQLDPGLLLPSLTLAKVKQNYAWDWAGVEREYRRTIALNPNSVVAYMYYSSELAETGRTAEAVSESLRARELAPVAYFPNVQVAWGYYLNRQYDQAVMESLKLIEWKPEMSWGYICQASAFQQTGHRREAVADLRKAVEVSKRGVFELMYLGHGLGISGAPAEGRAVLEEMLALSRTRHVPPEFIAVVYEGLGDRERAIQWFKKACAEKSMHPMIVPDPRLDAIRSDVRFTKLMQQMGLAREVL
jgi:TolB-like protein/Tfp pilus assembly protein PilF